MQVGTGTGLVTDTRGVDALRASAARDPRAAIKEAARQFEALFMHELMKSMRHATLSSGMLDNSGTQMSTEMLDAQFAQQMAGAPGGLSEVIAKHLARQLGASEERADAGTAPDIASVAGARQAHESVPKAAQLNGTQAAFVQQHLQDARAAEAHSGIPLSFMVAQAAHESAWGQREIRHADGRTTHNLFGIKAGASWKGPSAEVTTTEVVDGEVRKVKAKFRAYASYAESFHDYAKLLTDNPRYAQVLAQAGSAQGFAQELQRAGYATDPQYAEKLTRTINATLRLQRAVT